jgi:CubicO group peptidase (beta-lactamase class C family)
MLKFRIFTLMALLIVMLGTGASNQVRAFAASVPASEQPLRTSEPVGDIVADLEEFIPTYMDQEGIPGVAIALIRDGEVVWTEGFGVANTITGEPVTAETLFEVASNSKVVTAYIALRLVDQGVLSLDEPLNTYLLEPWLPPSQYRDTITLRHVLSHSSGLGHATLSRDNLFAPEQGYSYSAVGYQYLQVVIEHVTGQPLEQIAREIVYTPLGMSSSSFVNRSEFTPRTANGHLHAILPAILFAVLFLVSLLIVGAIGLVILRLRTGRWRPTRRQAIGMLSVAFVLSLLPPFILFEMANLLEFAWMIALAGFILVVVFAMAFLVGQAIILRLASKRPGLQIALTIIWSVLILVGLGLLASSLTNLPAPKWPQTEAEAAGSMRATAGDMAAFLIELSTPRHLSTEMATQMRTPQVELSNDISWGLGPGIQHSQEGDALWQFGQQIDFQSIMIIYPEHNFGVFVCTNNDLLNPDVALEIAHRALGGKIEPIRRAMNGEFNYNEDD